MMNLKSITAYKTSDGLIFEDEGNANEHQTSLNLSNKISKFVETYCYSGMTNNDVYDIIMENLDELRECLK